MKQAATRTKRRARQEARNDEASQLYASAHFTALANSWRRLTKQPLSAILTLLVIGIALALPAGLYLMVQNAKYVSGEWASALDLTVYVTPGTGESQITTLTEQIENNESVGGIIFISANEAIDDFKRLSGFGRALDSLDNNPLPASFIVRPIALDEDPERMQLLVNELQALENVDLVQLDTEWVARFHAILDVVRRGVLVAASLLALAVLVIIGNSIRMEIQQRRDEIEITKLVGGTDAFIRRPFIYSGLLFGLLGGGLAVVLVTTAIYLMTDPVQQVAGLYDSDFKLQGLVNGQWAWLMLFSVVLGVFGSWLAATRQIRQIEPG